MAKKLFLAILCLFLSVSTFAQKKGEMAAGVNLNLGTNSTLTNFGLGLKYQYNIIDNLRLEPSFNFFFGKDLEIAKYNMWDINVNAHYLFSIGQDSKFKVYPLAGIGLLGVSTKIKGISYVEDGTEYGVKSETISTTKFAFNIGAGAEYMVAENISVNLEIKYQIVSNWNRPIFSLGAAYHF